MSFIVNQYIDSFSKMAMLSGSARAQRRFIFCVLLLCVSVIVHAEEPAAFLWNKELAEQGDVAAQYNLGVMCEAGLGVPVDEEKAVKWYGLAADQGHAKAQLKLGLLYYTGSGARQSEIRALKWFGKAAKSGNPLAVQIQDRLLAGKRPEGVDIPRLMSSLRKALLESDDKALAELDRTISSARRAQLEKERAIEEKTIRQRRAQRQISGADEANAAVEKIASNVPGFLADATLQKNKAQAMDDLNALRLQAEKGMPGAQYSLGRIYETGVRLPMDKTLAVQWYRAAAEQKYAAAEYRLALAYLYGAGVARDEAQGRRWLKLAADHGHKVAENLWRHYSNKSDDRRSGMSVAVNWYLERAVEGDKEAQLRLGMIYEKGWGVAPSYREAKKWFTLAKQQGSREAEEHLIRLEAPK